MLILRKNNLLLFLIFTVTTNGCRDVSVPRPEGYFRIDLPDHEYRLSNGNISDSAGLPLSFEYPAYGKLSFESDNYSESGWFNIEFPHYKAKIYLTYIDINNDLEELMEQTYEMNVKNHIIKADAIDEQLINDPAQKIFGILYFPF